MKKILPFLLLLATFGTWSQQSLQKNIFNLQDVQLTEGPFKNALDLNIDNLLKYDTDRLLQPYLKEAGITPKGDAYINWDGLAGHIGGHYLSALAMSYAATGNNECKNRLDYMINELKACQDSNKNGYLGGIPDGAIMWNDLQNGYLALYSSSNYWVPWYNIHKTYAGLRDAWLYAQNDTAKQMFLDLCDWGINVASGLSTSQIQTMLNKEFGGMNEVYADAFEITGDTAYLDAAKRFTHNSIFLNLKNKVDALDNLHANTQIPKAIGFERIAQLDNTATTYATAASFFWETVVTKRSLALGGNSRGEHFPAAASCEDYITSREGPETCNTYNMLKLTADLFCDNHNVKYVDFYERALFNHILSSQHPEHGGYVYFTPARPRHYRVYSAPNEAMWCCVGSGMENPAKHAQFIYSYDADSLYLNLFIASELTWNDKGVTVTQKTTFPHSDSTTLVINTNNTTNFCLQVRYPSWVKPGELTIKINNQKQTITDNPGDFIKLTRTWNNNDSIVITTPMHTKYEQLPNVPDYIAFLHGPILLSAKTGIENLTGLIADDGRWSHIASGELQGLYTAPIVVGSRDSIISKIEKIESDSLKFKISKLFPEQPNYQNLILEPFSSIHDARYMMYWLSLSQAEYDAVIDELEAEENAKLELDQRTVDQVATGEQQPETDHKIQSSNSYTGIHMNEYWRDARNGGYVSYEMATGGNTGLSLMVRYWGYESGARSFNILVDGTVIATENITNKWNVNDFVNVEYPINDNLVTGKEYITVKFQAVNTSNTAGGLFYVRLLKPLTTKIKLNQIKDDGLTITQSNTSINIHSNTENGSIKILDIHGRLILTDKLENNEANINISGLSSGIYLVLCPVKNKYICKKIKINTK